MREVLAYVRKKGRHANPNLAHRCITDLASASWGVHGHSAEVEAFFREAINIARINSAPQRHVLSWDLSLSSDLSGLAAYLVEEGRMQEAEGLLNDAIAAQRTLPITL